MDVNNLLAGERFDEKLSEALLSCDVLIAIIGGRWTDLLRARASSSERDYVREEIAAALARGIVVIPVRVGRDGQLVGLPRADDLPDAIKDLVLHQKHDVTHERFSRDIAELIEAIVAVRRKLAPARPWGKIALGLALLAGVGLAAAYVSGSLTLSPLTDQFAGKNAIMEQGSRGSETKDALNKSEVPARSPKLAPGQSFRDCPTCPEMVEVPAGSFMMGLNSFAADHTAEVPERRVGISRPYAIGKYEVTFEEWDACVAGGGCSHKADDSGWGRGRRPVIDVSWDDAQAYVDWLSRLANQSYRLPTEAEWEYAARAGTTSMFSTGYQISSAEANFDGTRPYADAPVGEFRKQTVEVGFFKPNTLGLYDVHGNVWEWVEDCWHDSYVGAPSKEQAWLTHCSAPGHRVLRGGSWALDARRVRATIRIGAASFSRDNQRGFRVARTFNPSP